MVNNFWHNYVCLIAPISVWIGIQLFKFIYESIANRKLMWERLWGSGGMPSSHSAVVTCLAVLVGRYYGTSDPVFALAVFFAFITMYDAAGVRRAVGKQAKVINNIVQDVLMNKKLNDQQKLQELTGHTPFQVVVGAIIGLIVGLVA